MCVIIVKKRGVALPEYDILKAAHRANPHGCGFAALTENGLTSYKSLKFNKFYKRLLQVADIENDVIIHFRFATHGSKCPANCHPFANKDKTLYFAHNGVLPIRSINDKTDSEILFKSVLAPTAARYGLRSQTFDDVAAMVVGSSKFAFLDADGVKTVGDYSSREGVLYSNLRFMPLNSYTTGGFNYRTDDFYSDIFAEHNSAYKTAKFSF